MWHLMDVLNMHFYVCLTCEVGWKPDEGPDCWSCGKEGVPPRYVGIGGRS